MANGIDLSALDDLDITQEGLVSKEPPKKGAKKDNKKDDYTIEIIKDKDHQLDVFHLSGKDPDYEYRFLRYDDKNLSIKTGNLLFQKGGWQLCQRDHLKRIGIGKRFISPEGLYRVGDTVLSFMPKDLFKEKEAIKQEKASNQTDAIDRMMKEGDSQMGRDIHASMKGIQTQKNLDM